MLLGMEDTNNLDVNKLFERAIKDPTLLSNLDVDKLLDALENDRNDYLENKTIASITREIYGVVSKLNLPIDQMKQCCDRLNEYRLVNDINELHKGKHIKWIRIGGDKLIGGGIVVNIKFLDNGTHALVRTPTGAFVQIKYDDCHIFQKMTVQEQLILMAYEATK
jgi:hypothetical protein